jgi:outer membrane protein assembly factor BamB
MAAPGGESGGSAPLFAGKPLEYWVAEAGKPDRSERVERIVDALAQAVSHDDHSTKVAAADALAGLGPDALDAVPALIAQLGHEQPWVRVAAMGALASVGKKAVPALIDTFENETGGPRIRAGFVLGGIGPDAKAAVPVLAEAMKTEPPVIQQRLAGILNQIDPANYAGNTTTEGARTPVNLGPDDVEAAPGTTDWPAFHGPNRNSVCRERGLLDEWPEGGPKLLWTLEGLGRGFSNVSIAGGRLFTMGDRPIREGVEAQFVVAYDLNTRQELWASHVGLPFTTGPRCTPTVDGEVVYALGTEGNLVCLEAASGQVRWQRSLVDDFGGKIMTIWKYCESPLIDGDRLICTPGGDGAAIVALDKRTGDLEWKCAIPELGEKGADGAAYSSAVVAEIAGVRQYVQMMGRGAVGVEAETGRFLWGYNRIANNVANITTPIVQGDYVFVSTAYQTGSALLEIVRDAGQFRAEEVYFLGPRDFQNHHGGVVLVAGHFYGGHGMNRGDPTCIEAATGEVCWRHRAPAFGAAGVLYADGHLIFRYDRGDVVLIEASPDELRIKGRFTAIKGESAAYPHPVIHEGKLYLRHANVLACYDLRAYE